MDNKTIDTLRALNNGFYAKYAESFSSSRKNPWPGWERVLTHLEHSEAIGMLDLACGNMRFERFVSERRDKTDFTFTCVDTCNELVQDGVSCNFIDADIVQLLCDATPFSKVFGENRFDVVVSFGFMHHVPGQRLRAQLLDGMVDVAKPGGLIAVSFWRFATIDKLAEKALRITREACESLGLELDDGDYILGWNDVPGAYRYCHSFCEKDIDELEAHVGSRTTCIDRFVADGRNDALNGYVLLRKR